VNLRPLREPEGPWLFALVTLIVLLSRLPFLGAGYGADPDAWRAAWAARVIALTGQYEASRFPGYPLQEFVSAWLWRGGPIALNGASALLCAIGAGCFALTLRTLRVRDALLASLALASAPAVFLASVTAMDYAWALGFDLAALYCAVRGRAFAAGSLAGLAIASRMPSVGWLVPLALALAHAVPRGARRRSIAVLLITAVGAGAVAFLPVLFTYGPRFLRFYEYGYPAAALVLKNATADLWGVPGVLVLTLVVVFHAARGERPSLESAASGPMPPLIFAACASGIAIYAAIYLRLPIKAAYLLPVVPMVMIVLGGWLSRRAFAAVCLALLLSPWFLKLSQPGMFGEPPSGRGTVAMRVFGRSVALRLVPGPVLADRERREQGMRYVERSLERARALDGRAVVIAYDWLPQVRVRLGGKLDGRVEYAYVATAEELRAWARQGIRVRYLAGADWGNARVNGVDLGRAGARSLDATR
jgi:hypothetical protein